MGEAVRKRTMGAGKEDFAESLRPQSEGLEGEPRADTLRAYVGFYLAFDYSNVLGSFHGLEERLYFSKTKKRDKMN